MEETNTSVDKIVEYAAIFKEIIEENKKKAADSYKQVVENIKNKYDSLLAKNNTLIGGHIIVENTVPVSLNTYVVITCNPDTIPNGMVSLLNAYYDYLADMNKLLEIVDTLNESAETIEENYNKIIETLEEIKDKDRSDYLNERSNEAREEIQKQQEEKEEAEEEEEEEEEEQKTEEEKQDEDKQEAEEEKQDEDKQETEEEKQDEDKQETEEEKPDEDKKKTEEEKPDEDKKKTEEEKQDYHTQRGTTPSNNKTEDDKKENTEAETKKTDSTEDKEKKDDPLKEVKTETESGKETVEETKKENETSTVVTPPSNTQEEPTTTTSQDQQQETYVPPAQTNNNWQPSNSNNYTNETPINNNVETNETNPIIEPDIPEGSDDTAPSPEMPEDDIVKGNEYTKIPTSDTPIETKNKSGNSFIPIAAGLSAAAAAGIGAKAYMDRKNNSDNGEDDFNTEEWNGDESTISDYNTGNKVAVQEDTLEEDRINDDGYSSFETEKYGARNNEELADIQ